MRRLCVLARSRLGCYRASTWRPPGAGVSNVWAVYRLKGWQAFAPIRLRALKPRSLIIQHVSGFRVGAVAKVLAFSRMQAKDRKGPDAGALSCAVTPAQPTLRVKMLAWSAALDIAKNGKKLVPSVPRPS